MGAFTSRFGTRFIVVGVLPNILLIGYVGILVAAGAPMRSPSLGNTLAAIDHLTAYRVGVILLGVVVISAVTHPLQMPLIQLVEGYWGGLPFGHKMSEHATRRFEVRWIKVNDELRKSNNWKNMERPQRNSVRHARRKKDWLPGYPADLLPTDLGNTLWAGETMAGQRYGLDLNVALPRLIPLMSPVVLDELNERRNQLDASVRFSMASGVATVVSIGLLFRDGPWLFLALGTYLLCWASYRAAVTAARGFSTILAAAVDLYHLQLFDALSLERPAGIEEEIARNSVLTNFFRGYTQYNLKTEDKRLLRYVAPKAADTDGGGK